METYLLLFKDVEPCRTEIVLLIVNYWLLTSLSDTSSTLLRAVFSISTLITSQCRTAFTTAGRHLAFISEFATDIRHIEGQANRVADALSRNILDLEQSPINLDALASAQDQDEELLKLSTSPTSLQLAQVPLSHSRRNLLYDISQGRPRPLVPSAICRAIFDKLHSNFVSSRHQGLSSSDFRRVHLAQYEARHCLLDPYLP